MQAQGWVLILIPHPKPITMVVAMTDKIKSSEDYYKLYLERVNAKLVDIQNKMVTEKNEKMVEKDEKK